MGWWDSGILGGDMPWDVAGEIENTLKSKLNSWHVSDSWTLPERRVACKEITEFGGCDALFDSMRDWLNRLDGHSQCVLVEVLGISVMHAGAPITEKFRDNVLLACTTEREALEKVEALDNEERITALRVFEEAIRNYKGNRAVVIEQHTLMEKIAKKLHG